MSTHNGEAKRTLNPKPGEYGPYTIIRTSEGLRVMAMHCWQPEKIEVTEITEKMIQILSYYDEAGNRVELAFCPQAMLAVG